MRHRLRNPLAGIHPLIVICLAFTLLVALHTAFTPIFEAPDEVWHYAYVRWVAEGHGLPPLDEDRSGAYQEAAQPPLYYLVAALVSAPFDDQNLDDVMWGNPGFGYQAPGTVPDNKNMLIHTRDEALPWQGAALAIHATRLTSWAFGVLTVIAAWGFGYETFRSRRLALVTAALVAFQPQFVFLAGVVSNDTAAAAAATAALWLGARIVNRGTTWRGTLTAGVISAIAMLTKTSTLLVAPLLAVCLLFGVLRQRTNRAPLKTPASPDTPRRDAPVDRLLAHTNRDLTRRGTGAAPQRSTRWLRAPAHLAVQLSIAAVAGGWWYLRNALLYGELLGLGSHTETAWGRPQPATLVELIPELPLLLRSFWAAYGWGHVTWSDWVYVILWGITLPLLTGALGAIGHAWWRMLKEGGGLGKMLHNARRIETWAIPATMAAGWFAGITVALLRWMQQVQAPHGRLLFPAIGAWASLLTLGVQQLARRYPRAGRRYQRVLLTMSLVLTGLAPGARILATFAPPKLRNPESVVDACANPVQLQYGDWARLICAEVTPARALPGDEVTITTCWESLAPTTQNFTVFAHLIGPEASRPAERHTFPGLGRYPTSRWVPGTAFCDTFTLEVAAWADTPIRYQLAIGLFDAESDARLTAMTSDNRPMEPPLVGSVDVVAPGAMGTETMMPGDVLATFGTEPTLAELPVVNVPAAAQAGSDIDITLHWRARAKANVDYVAFIHLWEPGSDAPLAQNDAQPRNGWFPTTAWAVGDAIPDRHTLHIPGEVPEGSYPLWVGLYNPADGSRVATYGPSGPFAHDLVPLGEIRITSAP